MPLENSESVVDKINKDESVNLLEIRSTVWRSMPILFGDTMCNCSELTRIMISVLDSVALKEDGVRNSRLGSTRRATKMG